MSSGYVIEGRPKKNTGYSCCTPENNGSTPFKLPNGFNHTRLPSLISDSDIHSPGSLTLDEQKILDESEDSVPDMLTRRPGFYSQTKYNIVPSRQNPSEAVFVGRRDIRDLASVLEREITSSKGSVRGFKNRVRAGIATFWEQPDETGKYRILEHGKIIVYASSMSIVRETSDRCKSVRRLLQNHMVRYDERDLYMSRDTQHELRDRLAREGISEIHLPHVFADGIYMGGAEELEKLNESGQLRVLLDNYQKVTVRIMCDTCGGYRFIPCDVCHGSKRSLLRNHFTEEFCALRCVHCDEHGLQRCSMCIDQQE